MCPQLAELGGDEQGVETPRLRPEDRTGQELRQAWEKLQGQGARMVDCLGEEELEGTLGKPVEGIGEGSISGATRIGIVSQLEGLKLKVMVKSLEQVEDREARPSGPGPTGTR